MSTRTHLSGNEYDHVYTADDERILTYQPNVGYRWTLRDLDGKLLREFRAAFGVWTVERDLVYRDGVLLASVQPTGEVYHLHPDHLGSPRLVTGNGGARKAFHAYYPFGDEATGIAQDGERMKFTGHERDLGDAGSAADDIDYMHARYYLPQLERFLSTDPLNGNPREPQSWNRYAYVLNRPTTHVDPFGLEEVSIQGTNRPIATFSGFIIVSAPAGTPAPAEPSRPPDWSASQRFLFNGSLPGRRWSRNLRIDTRREDPGRDPRCTRPIDRECDRRIW